MSFNKHAGSAYSKINKSNTAPLCNLFSEQPHFLGQCGNGLFSLQIRDNYMRMLPDIARKGCYQLESKDPNAQISCDLQAILDQVNILATASLALRKHDVSTCLRKFLHKSVFFSGIYEKLDLKLKFIKWLSNWKIFVTAGTCFLAEFIDRLNILQITDM